MAITREGLQQKEFNLRFIWFFLQAIIERTRKICSCLIYKKSRDNKETLSNLGMSDK